MNKSKKTFNFFDKHEKFWETSMGSWFPGQRIVFRGKDLFTDLKDISWMGLLLYGITGRFFDDKQIRLFESIWILSTSYPEPRLWNNRIAALAGTARSSGNLGLSAALAVSEAKVFGHQVNRETSDFLFRVMDIWKSDENLEEHIKSEMKTNRRIGGFGRPIIKTDERLAPLIDIAEQLDFSNGDYVKLVFSIEKILIKNRYRMYMNVSALTTALLADQGLDREEIYHYRSLMFSAGIIPCFIDAANKPTGAFFPLSCEKINYQGEAIRSWE